MGSDLIRVFGEVSGDLVFGEECGDLVNFGLTDFSAKKA